MNEDGHTSSIRDKILTIAVKRGWKPGTRITFPQEGDQGPNTVPGTEDREKHPRTASDRNVKHLSSKTMTDF